MKKSKKVGIHFSKRHWLLIIMGFVSLFMSGSIQNESMNVVIPKLMAAHPGWTDGQISVISTCAQLIGALAVFGWGWLAQKYGARRFLILSLALEIIGFASTGYVTTLAAYAFFRIVTVLGTLATMNYFVAVMATNWFPSKKGIALSYITIGNNVSSMVAIWIISLLWKWFGFGAGSAAYAMIALIPIILIITAIPEYPEQCGEFPDSDRSMTHEDAMRLLEEGKRYEKESKWTVRKLLVTPQVWKLGVCLGLMCLTISGILTHLVALFTTRGYTTVEGMTAMTICAAAAIPLSFFRGYLDLKRGARFSAIFIGVMMAICFFLSLIPGKWSVIFAALAAAADMGCLNSIAISLPASVFGRFDMKRAQSVILPIMQILQAIGVGLTGVLSDMTGSFMSVLAFMGVCSVVSVVILLTLKDECIGRKEA